VRSTSKKYGNDARKSGVGFSDAVANTVEEIEQQRWYGVVMLCHGRINVVVVESQAVVCSSASIRGVRTQCCKYVTETVTSGKIRAVNHAFCTSHNNSIYMVCHKNHKNECSTE